ncbi:MAG: S41 family peptidase [Omnitrophica WOR_2 bacterium]
MMESRPPQRHVIPILVIGLIFGIVIGIILDSQVLNTFALGAGPATVTTSTSPDFKLMNEAWNVIQRFYVDRQAVDAKKLTYGGISGMVDALGDTGHTRFLTPEMLKAENNYTRGEFEGIGAEVQMKDGHVVIVAPIDNSPAQKAGLRPGDAIIKVNGQDVSGLPLTDVVSRIVGPAGTKVTITVMHPGSTTPQDYTLTRAKITLQNVTWSMVPGTKIAHIRLAAFSQNVSKDLQKALQDAQNQGATGIILDLRSNPGGLLNEAISVTSQFLSSGNVLQEKDATGNIKNTPVEPGGVALKIPLVVLINQGSASASEIVAGALQDAGRAKLVGEKTFGTGTVLKQFDLSDGSAMLVATEEWLTPKGRVIWHQGIAPDTSVTLPANATPLTPEAETSMTPQQVQSSGDSQLLEGLKILN